MSTALSNTVLWVEERIRLHPEKTALAEWDRHGQEQKISFAELGVRTAALASALAREGVKHGDRVLVLVPMSIDLYISILGIFRIGAVCAFVDPAMGARLFDSCCATVKPAAFIGAPKAHIFRLLSPSVRRVPLMFCTGSFPIWGARRLAKLFRAEAARKDYSPAPVARMTPDETVLISFTTGSSGRPKGSRRTQGFLLAQLDVLNVLEKADCDSDFPGFPILPLENLARGRTTYLPQLPAGKVRQVSPGVIWSQLHQWKPQMMSGSPAYLEALADAAVARGIQADFVRVLYTGGAPVTVQALEKFLLVWPNARVQVVYGSTEAEPVTVIDAAELLTESIRMRVAQGLGCCVGKPVSAIEVRILSLDRKDSEASDINALCVAVGEVGEVTVRGAHVNETYWEDPEAERANKIRTPEGVWHRMGDAGYLDEEGRLWLTGRVHTAMRNPNQIHGAPAPAGWSRIFPYQAELVADTFPEVRKSALLQYRDAFYLVVEPKFEVKGEGDRETLKVDLHTSLNFLPLQDVLFHTVPVDARHNSKVEYGQLKTWLLNTLGEKQSA